MSQTSKPETERDVISQSSKGGTAPVVTQLDPASFTKVVEHIDKHLSQHISIQALAGLLEISRHHFSRRFKMSAGMSPHAFITKRRMDLAWTLLTQTDLPHEKIVEEIGLSHMGHFRRRFRKHFGINPSSARVSLQPRTAASAPR